MNRCWLLHYSLPIYLLLAWFVLQIFILWTKPGIHRQSLEHLLACFCQKTNCRKSMWPLCRNWLSSWDYQNLRFLPWPGVKRGALYFLVSFHYVRTSRFCGVSTLTSLLFSLEEFELRALPKSEMNCRTISKLLSTLIRADTSGLPAGYGALT